MYRGIEVNFTRLEETCGVEQEHVDNLMDLVLALRNMPPPKMRMAGFVAFDVPWDTRAEILGTKEADVYGVYGTYLAGQHAGKVGHDECGTACCAVGTGAYRGIGNPQEGESWEHYSDRVFLPGRPNGSSANSVEWEFLFDGNWQHMDNTPRGAAARIIYLLVKGEAPRLLKRDFWQTTRSYKQFLDTPIEARSMTK